MNIHMNSHVNDAILEKKTVSVATSAGVRSKYQILHWPYFCILKIDWAYKKLQFAFMQSRVWEKLGSPHFYSLCIFYDLGNYKSIAKATKRNNSNSYLFCVKPEEALAMQESFWQTSKSS